MLWVSEYVKANPGKTMREVVRAMGCQKSSGYDVIQRTLKAGLIRREPGKITSSWLLFPYQKKRAVITHFQGCFWLRFQEKSSRVPTEHCSSLDNLTAWVDSQVDGAEVFLNFDSDLLPGEATKSSAILPQKEIKAPTPPRGRVHNFSMRNVRSERAPTPLLPRASFICCNKECGKTFFRRASKRSEGQENFYCSRACGNAGKTKQTFTHECAFCNVSFTRASKDHHKLHFCCRDHHHQHSKKKTAKQ